MRDYLQVPFRATRAYRESCRIAAAQRAAMRYRVASVENVSGVTASAACRRGS